MGILTLGSQSRPTSPAQNATGRQKKGLALRGQKVGLGILNTAKARASKAPPPRITWSTFSRLPIPKGSRFIHAADFDEISKSVDGDKNGCPI